jgi:ADP-heptose:LPS heptosyltransferase
VSARSRHAHWLLTAHALRRLELLITVDAGIAHLTGAMGVPVWILLPHVPDWRWGLHSERTPWYASARLFRQPARDAWDRVITTVIDALRTTTRS